MLYLECVVNSQWINESPGVSHFKTSFTSFKIYNIWLSGIKLVISYQTKGFNHSNTQLLIKKMFILLFTQQFCYTVVENYKIKEVKYLPIFVCLCYRFK